MELARKADAAQTFDACFRAHRERVFHVARRLGGGDTAFAEDVTHDAFIKLLEHLPDLADTDDLGGWLYRVTVNTALSRLRRERSVFGRVMRALRAEEEPRAPSAEAILGEHEEAAAAMRALAALPPKERVVLSMKVLDGMSQQEIARTLSMSEGYVSKLAARAWQRVRAAGWEVDDAEA
jgi:RNA polymerase sigma factor (sigma-70 family)